ncbi:AP endonuclease [Enterococcus sp. JM4C]|uniref:sugar phosphate isomerase/epimerase family protein n=1 Tax=Candidatus Enterococcus huntleyi TaxID=1857217 RepID=UPI00137ABF38|nr:sugar phosphate isomerase/epimerase family protein [Enterococcus sp. JM4C]KAF1299152.1 AP endonuclease [Enterococcus sp. JM4C]
MLNTLNLGIRAHDIQAETKEQLVEKLASHQFTHIQFAPKKSFPTLIQNWTDLTPDFAKEYGDYFANQNIKLSVLGCYVNISSRDALVRQQAINLFKQHLHLAKSFQAKLVGTETGSVTQGYTTENFTEEAYIQARTSIIELVTLAETLDVTVGIEAGLNHPVYTSDLMKRLLDEIQSPHLKVIFDAANLIRPDNYLTQEAVVEKAIEQLHAHIEVVHLKDFVIHDKKIKIVPVGTGQMNYKPVLSFLKNQQQLPVSLEATREADLATAFAALSAV